MSKLDYNIIDNKARLLLDNSGIVDNLYSVNPQKGMLYIKEFEKIKKDYEDYNKYSGQKRINSGIQLEKDLDNLSNKLSKESDFINRFKNIYSVAEKQGDKKTLEEMDGKVEFINKFYKEVLPSYGKEYLKDNKENKKTGDITDILPGDTETPKQEEVKEVTTPVVDTTKQVTGTTPTTTTVPVDTKPEYRGRQLIYDKENPTKIIGFKSKNTGEDVYLKKGETAQSKIDEGIKGYTDFKDKTKEYLNQFEGGEKDKAKKQIEKKVFDPGTGFKSWDDILGD